ncbi:MAG: CDP-alcohol phosphatidyltransferase family protein [Nanoarchaeota archaeon]
MANGKNHGKIKNKLRKVKDKIKKAEKEIKDEIILNVPNSVTLLRLFLMFIFVYMLFMNYSKISLVVVFGIAALTDWFDGFLARKLNQKTKIGARLDQVIDRVFTGCIFFALIIFLVFNSKVTTQNIFVLSPTNIFLLLFLSVSREIIGLRYCIVNVTFI